MAQRVGRGIALPFLTAALEGVSGQQHASAALYLREILGAHCTGGWVGPRASLDGGRSRPTGIRSLDHFYGTSYK